MSGAPTAVGQRAARTTRRTPLARGAHQRAGTSRARRSRTFFAGVAHQEEHRPRKSEVPGSSPGAGSLLPRIRPVVALVRDAGQERLRGLRDDHTEV